MTSVVAAEASGVFLPPPEHMQANQAGAWLILAMAVVLLGVPTCIAAARITRKTKSPLLLLVMLGCATVFPFLVEPLGDIIGATWYPADSPLVLATVFGRHIPLYVVAGYAFGVAGISYAAYALMIRGTSARQLLLIMGGFSLVDCLFEMTAIQLGVMHYYGNHALILGLPIYSIVQNGGLIVVCGVALTVLVPHLQGWRSAFIPFVVPLSFAAYAVICTAPAYWAIHSESGPAVFWTVAIASTVLNLAIAVLAVFSPPLKRLRHASINPSPAVAKPTSARTQSNSAAQ